MHTKSFSDFGHIVTALRLILQSLPVTLLVTSLTIFFSTAIAFLFAAAKIQNIRGVERIITALISFLRGTPVLVQLFIAYYGIPALFESFGIPMNGANIYIFPVTALSLHGAAFLSEIMRSAWLGVDRGQIEAAYSIGMGTFQMFRRILFPQAFKIALPNLGNYTIDMLKESSLVFSVGLLDIMGRTKMLNTAEYGLYQLENYVIVAVIYWVICMAVERCFLFFEKISGRGHADIGTETR